MGQMAAGERRRALTFLGRVGSLGAALIGVACAGAAPAQAAPAPATPTVITVAGPKLPSPLTVRAGQQPELFAAVLSQVSWMRAAVAQSTGPAANRLGPKYTVTVLAGISPTQLYELYPLAAGGPRAYRPGQPDRRATTTGWLYARLSLPESLRAAGVPLAEAAVSPNGGVGGGSSTDVVRASEPPDKVHRLLTDFHLLVLINGGVVLTIALGVAGIARLARRRNS
jgi:hypothetical protein